MKWRGSFSSWLVINEWTIGLGCCNGKQYWKSFTIHLLPIRLYLYFYNSYIINKEGVMLTEKVVLYKSVKWPPKIGEWVKTESTIQIRCGGCGEIMNLDRHIIHPDGSVMPSVSCPYKDEGCKWHAIIKLENWGK